MAMKTIRVTAEIHTKLAHLGLKSETYNDIIARLIEAYEKMYFEEELSDDEADYYNERIRLFENGDYTGTRKVDLNAIRK
jgi:predicted CopG family antitoxin